MTKQSNLRKQFLQINFIGQLSNREKSSNIRCSQGTQSLIMNKEHSKMIYRRSQKNELFLKNSRMMMKKMKISQETQKLRRTSEPT